MKKRAKYGIHRSFSEGVSDFMYYTYIIQSINHPEQYYIGYSSDLKERLERHNKGYVKHTSKFLPWKLHAYFAFNEKSLAVNFEKYLKTGSGIAFRNRHFKKNKNDYNI